MNLNINNISGINTEVNNFNSVTEDDSTDEDRGLISSRDRISELRTSLGFETYSDTDDSMPSSLVTNDSATGNNVDLSNGVTELSSQINSNGVGVSGVTIEPDTPPPPAALAFWDDFYAKGSYSEDWIYKAVDDYNERKVGGNVIIVGGHAGHSLGDLIGDAGGISGLDNGYGSGNQNTENDA